MGIGAVCAYLDHAAADLSHLVVPRAVMAVEGAITEEAVDMLHLMAGVILAVPVLKISK